MLLLGPNKYLKSKICILQLCFEKQQQQQQNTELFHGDAHGEKSPKLDISVINPLSPLDALKNHFTLLKTDLIFLQARVLE